MERYIMGIDEVGRGALAGPVVISAVLVSHKFSIPSRIRFIKLEDSKKLTPSERQLWCDWLKNRLRQDKANKREKIACVSISARIYPKRIDEINISRAANLAAYEVLKRSVRLLTADGSTRFDLKIYLDGGLYFRSRNFQSELSKKFICHPMFRESKIKKLEIKTVIKGDEKLRAIKLASIMAKVSRDSYMRKQSKSYPFYDFHEHKGYGTKAHFESIRKHGLSKIHRLTFASKRLKINNNKT